MPKMFQSPCCRAAAALLALSGTFWGLTGCAGKPAAAPPGAVSSLPAPQIQDTAVMTKEQKLQQRGEIYKYIQTLSPQERAAYFKAHPEVVQSFVQ